MEKTTEWELIKDTLRANPGINALELAKLTNLSASTILKYINDGSISTNLKQKKNIKGYYMPKEVDAKWHIDIENLHTQQPKPKIR